MSITIRDVAQAAGVSTATVSRVVNQPDSVRGALRVELNIATNHEASKLFRIRGSPTRNVARHSPVAQNSHTVRDLDNFAKFVANEHN